jgi:hypothetical protein
MLMRYISADRFCIILQFSAFVGWLAAHSDLV